MQAPLQQNSVVTIIGSFGSHGASTGWQTLPVLLDDATELAVVAVVPVLCEDEPPPPPPPPSSPQAASPATDSNNEIENDLKFASTDF